MYLPPEAVGASNKYNGSLQPSSDPSPPARIKMHNIASIAKHKTKKALHIAHPNDARDNETRQLEDAMQEINESPAFNSSKLLNKARIESSGLSDKAIATLQATSQFIYSPTSAIKTRATKRTAGKLAKSQPYLSRQADLDFLTAHDDLQTAQGFRYEDDNDDADGMEMRQRSKSVNQCEDHIKQMESTRESMRVAWVTTRHIQRVRAIDLIPPPPLSDDAFEEPDEYGFTEFHWGKWIAYVCAIIASGRASTNKKQEYSTFFAQLHSAVH